MSDGPIRVLIVAGEASGDLYGGILQRAMLRLLPGLTFSGIGGPAMRAAGLEPLADAASVGVTGMLEVVSALPRIWRAFKRAAAVLKDRRRPPALAILIDYPDFNLRLAAHARRAGVPVLYFISPQVWAWRPGRIADIARVVDRLFVVLPFEEEIYRGAQVNVSFIGHPLLDLVRAGRTRDQTLAALGLDRRRPTVGLLPGSRRNEIAAHLPLFLAAAERLAAEFRDVQFLLPVAPTIASRDLRAVLRRTTRAHGAPANAPGTAASPVLVEDDRYDAIAACDAAAVASGTATLECALLGVPMVVVYRLHALTHWIVRRLSTVPHIGIPNLIAGHRVVPELVQGEATPPRLFTELRRILTDPVEQGSMRRALHAVCDRLGPPGALDRLAAEACAMIDAGAGVGRARAGM